MSRHPCLRGLRGGPLAGLLAFAPALIVFAILLAPSLSPAGSLSTGPLAQGALPAMAPHMGVAKIPLTQARTGALGGIAPHAKLPVLEAATSVSTITGTNYQVSDGSGFQVEPSVAVNPLNSSNVIVVAADQNIPAGLSPGGWTSVYTSHDGGSTWGYHPANINSTFGRAPCISGDDNVVFTTGGLAIVAGIAYPDAFGHHLDGQLCNTPSPDNETNGGLFVEVSNDSGNTWSAYPVFPDFPGVMADKEWIAVDPTSGVISLDVMLWVYLENNFQQIASGIYYFYSELSVRFWSGPVPVAPFSSPPLMVAADLAVDAAGGVDVAWWNMTSYTGGPTNLSFSRASVPGLPFSAPRTVATIRCAPNGIEHFPALKAFPRMGCFPHVFTDMSPVSPNHGTIYITYSTNASSMQVMLVSSRDNGTTWSSPVPVNNDPSDGADHWWPQGTTGKNGTVYVEFMDRRYDPGNYYLDTSMGISTDGGKTFARNVRLSTISGDPAVASNIMGTGFFMAGDYQGTAWSPQGVVSAWTDMRNGVPGVNNNEDIYMGKLAWLDVRSNIPGTSLTIDGVTTAGSTTMYNLTGTVHAIVAPASINWNGSHFTFLHWQGAYSSSSNNLTAFRLNGTGYLTAVYANDSAQSQYNQLLSFYLPTLPCYNVMYGNDQGSVCDNLTAPARLAVEAHFATILDTPIPGAAVTFRDSLGDAFSPAVAYTNTNGYAWSNVTLYSIDDAVAWDSLGPVTMSGWAAAPGFNTTYGDQTYSTLICSVSASDWFPCPASVELMRPITVNPITLPFFSESALFGEAAPANITFGSLPSGGAQDVEWWQNPRNDTQKPLFTFHWNIGGSVQSTMRLVTLNNVSAPLLEGNVTVTDADGATATAHVIAFTHTAYLNVTQTPAGGGTVYLDGSPVTPGLEMPVTAGRHIITATPAHGYLFRNWTVTSGGMSVNRSVLTVNDTGTLMATFVTYPALTGSLNVSHPEIDLGGTTKMSLTTAGGAGGTNISWTGLPPGCTAPKGSTTLNCTPTSTGTFDVDVTLTDDQGNVLNVPQVILTVNPALRAKWEVSNTAGAAPRNVSFSAHLTGGTPQYSYAVSFGDGAHATGDNVTHLYTTAGAYVVHLWANDSAGASNETSMALTIYTPLVAQAYASPTIGYVGSSTALSVTVQGGSGIYGYSWTGLPAGCSETNGSVTICTPKTTGQWTVHVKVTDSVGDQTNVSLVFAEEALPTSGGSSGGNNAAGLTDLRTIISVIGIILGVIGVSVRWLQVRHRKREKPSSETAREGSEPPGQGAPATVEMGKMPPPQAGAALPAAAAPLGTPSTSPAGTTLPGAPVFCGRCGSENSSAHKYCLACGRTLRIPPRPPQAGT